MSNSDMVLELRRLLAAATERPWEVGVHSDDPMAFVQGCAAFGTGPVWMAISGWDIPDEQAVIPAMTGNGPTSEKNAALIVAAVNALPSLLDALERYEALIQNADLLRAALTDCISVLEREDALEGELVTAGRARVVLTITAPETPDLKSEGQE